MRKRTGFTWIGFLSILTAALMMAGCAGAGSESIAESTEAAASQTETDSTEEARVYPAPDFELIDQYGFSQRISDYRGKVIFLNFWATWCGPCREEMPDIQSLYEEYGENTEEVVFLGVAFPGAGGEEDEEGIASFLQENGFTYPVAMDPEGRQMTAYGITAYPTTYMIDRDGNLFGYVTGSLTKESMEDVIRQTLSGERTR